MGEGNTTILGDCSGDLRRNLYERRTILVLPEERQHLTAETTHFAVRQNRFQAVSDLGPILVVVHRKQHHHATIFAFGPYAPFLE